jgi:hypothetical protein
MLVYTGGGYGGFLPGVPARDLSDDEVDAYGGESKLLGTGLYARVGDAKPARKPRGVIDLNDGVSNDEARLAGQALRAERDEKGK